MEILAAPWATTADVCGACVLADDADPTEVASLEDKLLIASEILFAVTGYQWPGEVSDIIRPRPGHGKCGCTSSRRGCSRVSEVQLPGYPVVEVTQVLIDGVVVDPDWYRVDDSRYLVWQLDEPELADGRNGWPCCQRQKLPSTEDETFEIEYVWGQSPPRSGVVAAAALACEFHLACSTDETQRRRCRLPGRVKAIARQGVALELMDSFEMFSEGRSGIPEVDMWVGSLMLGRSRARSSVIDTQAFALRGNRNRRNGLGGGS